MVATDYGYAPLRSQSPSASSDASSGRYSSDDDGGSEKDLLRQKQRRHRRPSRSAPSPTTTTTDCLATVALLLTYFALNVGLTFYNKTLLNGFPYPYFITAVHTGSGVVGCAMLRLLGVGGGVAQAGNVAQDDGESGRSVEKPAALPRSSFSPVRIAMILAYSSLYTANIAASNASLGLVSVPFHQIIRSTCPAFTLLLAVWLMGARWPSSATMAALVLVVGGAAMSCFGQLSFTSTGFAWTVLGTLLAAVKTLTTNVLLRNGGGGEEHDNGNAPPSDSLTQRLRQLLRRNGVQLSALQLLQVMSPLACAQCVLASYCSGELRGALQSVAASPASPQLVILLAGNGALAFMLNFVSFRTNKATGPLTMTVVGNAKQVTTVVGAVPLFHLHLAAVNAAGIVVALAGTAWYGVLAVREKKRR